MRNLSKSTETSSSESTVERRLRILEEIQRKILDNQSHMKDSIKDLKETNVTALSKMNAVLNRKEKKGQQNEFRPRFPIMNLVELTEVNSLCSQDPTHYTQLLKSLISPDGIVRNFHRLIDRNFIQLLNYDGVSNKFAFKDYAHLNASLFDALKRDGYTEKEYVQDIRTAFKNYKNVFYKKKCEELKKLKKVT